jgi:cell wall-associated NlpC family hydrolase
MSPIRDTRAHTPASNRSIATRVATRVAAVLTALGVFVPVGWVASSTLAPAQAGTSIALTSTSAASTSSSSTKRKVRPAVTLRIAKAQKGKPYRRGASGPRAFDCSGLVKYVMKRQHKSMPRTAQAQYRSVKKIAKSRVKKGDLVFFRSGGRVYHVGIYAGHHRIWHAPRPGKRVKLAKIWTGGWTAGRVVA